MFILVANEASTDLARKVADRLEIPFSEMLRRRFADGECYHAFPRSIAGQTSDNHRRDPHERVAYQELLDLIQGGRYWNAASVNVVIPYLGYSTMERAKPLFPRNPQRHHPDPPDFPGQAGFRRLCRSPFRGCSPCPCR
jgi:ribose-phosphate pyrophosphokinase